MSVLRAFICLLATVAVLDAAEPARKLAFSRNDALYVCQLDGSAAKKVATGSWPDISPDGTRLAFNTEDPSGKSPERHIAIADLATGKATRLPGIPSNNCHSPLWSPDGSQLLFYIYSDNDWHVGLIKADGTGFRYVKKAESKGHSLWSLAWTPDGQSFYAQDLDSLYRVNLSGGIQKKWTLAKLFPEGGFNSGARISVSPDGDTLLLDVDMDEDVSRKDWDGPPPSIWALDLKTEKTTRLTAKGLFAWEPRWFAAGEFLCILQPASAKVPSIYRLSANGKMRLPLVKDARTPSASR